MKKRRERLHYIVTAHVCILRLVWYIVVVVVSSQKYTRRFPQETNCLFAASVCIEEYMHLYCAERRKKENFDTQNVSGLLYFAHAQQHFKTIFILRKPYTFLCLQCATRSKIGSKRN
jgi:hypothetical protein